MNKFFLLILFLLTSVICKVTGINPLPDKINPANICTVKTILRDGQGDFDPWNKSRWEGWYDADGRIIRPFELDTSVTFKARQEPWELVFSDEFDDKFFLPITQQGIQVDGNGVVLDARTENQKLPLEELFLLGKPAWSKNGTCEIGGIYYDLPIEDGVPPTVVSNFTFMGLKRGVKINGTGEVEEHRLIVEHCVFQRNRVGFYTNGYDTLLRNCELSENGYGAIYSGSKSRRNQFVNNVFRDNTLSQHQHSYGDFIGDTFFDSEISSNRFIKSRIKGDFRRIGISMFRNMGEGINLREQMPHNNIIRNNYFEDYSVAIHIGARMGRETRNDVSQEGRDYAFYNVVDGNTIVHTDIGIKINTEGNTVKSNTFKNVKKDIVLHCVFFELENTTINDQKNATVHFWYTEDDYPEYDEWFRFQDDRNEGINKEEKVIEVFSRQDSPDFLAEESEQFLLNPPQLDNGNILKSSKFGLPSVVDSGEYSLDLPGKEFIAVWDKPVSRVDGDDYYDILVFDDQGTEINRCARSESPWKYIVAGYFTKEMNNGEMQIAAISREAKDGAFPVFIFNRGFMEPETILYRNNKDPDMKISSTADHKLKVEYESDK